MIKNMFNLTPKTKWAILASRKTLALMLMSVFMLSGCIEPTSIVQKPKAAVPAQINAGENNNGAIYNAKSYRAMFADRRPQFVGDMVTIKIAENTSAKKSETNSKSSANSNDSSITALFKTKETPKAVFGASGERTYDNSGASNMSNVFSGSLTATVVEVLPNGFLVVRGEKQVGFDTGTEFVRISGIVNPDNITQGNIVSSTSIGDARVEYRTSTKIDAAEVVSKFARFFLSMGF